MPDHEVVEVVTEPTVIEIVQGGPKGDKGDSGIIVSPTPPPNPTPNTLWVDSS